MSLPQSVPATRNPEVRFLEGAFPNRLGQLSLAEAVQVTGTSLTSPGTLSVVAQIATRTGEQPLLRRDLEEATGLSQGQLSKTMRLLTSIGAVEEGQAMVRHGNNERSALTVVPSETFGSFVEDTPEWGNAIEAKQLDDRVMAIAEQQGLTRNQTLEMLLANYESAVDEIGQ